MTSQGNSKFKIKNYKFKEREKPLKVLVLGLGSYAKGTGVSSALHFARLGCQVIAADQKEKKDLLENYKQLSKFKNVKFHLGGWRAEDADWADLIIKNPGVRRNNEVLLRALKSGKPVENDITIFLKKARGLTIGITGTRGKTTTTAWIGDMFKRSGLRHHVGGNITVSPLVFLDKVKEGDISVLELSSWLLETCGSCGLSPDVAVWTNLMSDHLNTYDGMDDYAEAKAQIMRNQKPDGCFVANLDDAYVKRYAAESPARVLGFSAKRKKGSSAFVEDGWLKLLEGKREIKLIRSKDIGLKGGHNVMNALAAALAARIVKAKIDAIRQSLKEFGGMPYRQEIIGNKKGITFVNDTTSTTPDAAVAALKAFASDARGTGKTGRGLVHWICGGAEKGLDFSELASVAKGKRVKIYMLDGTARANFSKALESKGLDYALFESLQSAFVRALNEAAEGDTILLSPACASFGMFKNEFDRGDQFNDLFKSVYK